MATDKYIVLRNASTGQSANGYYGFSWETLFSLGFVWLRRGNLKIFRFCMVLFVCDWVVLPAVIFAFPEHREILLDPAPTISLFNTFISMRTATMLFFVLYIASTFFFSSAGCNAAHTRELLSRGYGLPPAAPNLEEARKALRLSNDRTPS